MPVVRDYDELFAAIACGTGLTKSDIDGLSAYQASLLYDELVGKQIRQLANQLKTLSPPILPPPEPKTRNLPGGQREVRTSGMMDTKQVLNAAQNLEAQVKNNG